MEVQVQSAIVEFILNHTDVLFRSKSSPAIGDGAEHSSLLWPKSLWVSSPSTKLLTLEEAQAQTRGHSSSPVMSDSRDIEVEEGPTLLQEKLHTVIDFQSKR